MNEKRKQDYLSTMEPDSPKYLTTITMFRSIAPFEDEYGIDVCEMNQNILSSVFARLGWVNYSTFCVYSNTIKHYTNWCISLGYTKDNANPAVRLNPSELSVSTMRRMYYKDDAMFYETLDHVFDLSSDASKDRWIIHIAALICAWCGLTTNEIRYLRKEQVAGNQIVLDDGTTIAVMPQCVELLRYTKTITEIFVPNSSGGIRTRYMTDSPYLLRMSTYKPTGGDVIGSKQLARWCAKDMALQRQLPITDPHRDRVLTISRLNTAARFVRMYEWEQENETITSQNAAKWYPLTRLKNKLPCALVAEYNTWKKAFYDYF